MKNFLLWLPFSFFLLSAGTHTSTTKQLITKQPADKCVSFVVYKGNNYSSLVYNNTSAAVQITIEKVNKKGRVAVWQKRFEAKQLNSYPDLSKAAYQNVVVHNMHDKQEHLEVTYTIIYNSKGSELQMHNRSAIMNCCNKSRLEINI